MGIIISMIMGLIVGFIAKAIVPGKDPGGLIVTMLIGIGGGLIGGILASVLGMGGAGIGSFVFAVIGAIILLVGWRTYKNSSR